MEDESLYGLTNLYDHQQGHKSQLTDHAELQIFRLLKHLSQLGFVQSVSAIKSSTATMARKEGNPFLTVVPSDDLVFLISFK